MILIKELNLSNEMKLVQAFEMNRDKDELDVISVLVYSISRNYLDMVTKNYKEKLEYSPTLFLISRIHFLLKSSS
jgi:chromatin segregation and condensation protein Rec8/ScpA/Scc1 (kleisin family)